MFDWYECNECVYWGVGECGILDDFVWWLEEDYELVYCCFVSEDVGLEDWGSEWIECVVCLVDLWCVVVDLDWLDGVC